MDGKPFFVVLFFILFLLLLAGGALRSENLAPGDGDFRPPGGSSGAEGDVDYNVFGGSSGNKTAVGGASASSGGVAGGPCGNVYTVLSGDTLSRIAQKCGIALDVLLSINPTISNPNLIKVGQQVNIYVAPAQKSAPTKTAAPKPSSTPDDQLRPGGHVPVEIHGFPPNTEVTVAIARENEKPVNVDDGKTDEKGHFKIKVAIPKKAKAGEKWVVTITTTGKNPVSAKSPVFTLHK